jgi:pilus assembly protein CpaB
MNRRFIAILVSVAIALVGTTTVFVYVKSADSRAVAGKTVRQVVVAEKKIPSGTSGKSLTSYLRTVNMPAETVPQDALSAIDGDLEPLVLTSEVQRGQLLLRAMFGTRSTTAGITIPEGMVAAAVKVKVGVLGAGTVTVGSRVAVFYTYTALDDNHRNTVSGTGLEKDRAANSITRLLLNNIEILALASGTKSGTETTGDSSMVTFALTQVDAERLAHAVALGGELNIVLLGDSSKVSADPGVDNRSLF